MAESKNNFLKGKMNKDLDSRLLSNSEYRDALNISVGKSENESVGSLQNILGNSILTKPTLSGSVPFETNENLVCIGSFVDNENNRIYQFLTDYQDPNPSNINLPDSNSEMKVTVYDPSNTGNPYVTLLEGTYLNFSTTNLITGINVVEGLLFWTDNRNQPRKINVNSAIANPADSPTPYYTDVDQISVAKYYPFIAPGIFSIIENNVIDGVPILEGGQTKIPILTITIGFTGLAIGDQLVGNGITAGDSAIVTNIVGIPGPGGLSWVYVSGDYTSLLSDGDALTFYRCAMNTVINESNINGNDNFLTDKFVRFSYRFKFDDNEISLMAPFTQPVFIPEQKGYFMNGDEDAAYRSTVVDWMQNAVSSVNLFIELPEIGNNLFNRYKIKSIEILYKESDSLAVKVVESVDILKIQQQSPLTNIYSYTYDSQKPRKTLPEAETLRVYDKIPVRALAQENVGNRIVYGNFINQNTPPETLNYNVTVVEKATAQTPFESWIEYPNHTLKQNRTYQVGIVLSDKFGRQSSVILSSASPYTEAGDIIYGASSVFFPYKNEFWATEVRKWMGDELALIFNEEIKSIKDESVGTPGLYATVSGVIPGSSAGFEISSATIGDTYIINLTGGTTQNNIPSIGNYLKGKYTDYVKVINIEVYPVVDPPTPMPSPPSGSYVITTDGPISPMYEYDPDLDKNIKYSYAINELGWYSYKVVVKQQEQEYYNVYTPGMLAGYPVWQTFNDAGPGLYEPSVFPAGENDSTCHFVLINDNINKVPRDLSEVGPNQRQYRSSVQLWGRVENVLIEPLGSLPDTYTTNRQYYPGTQSDVVNTIAPTTELGFTQTSDGQNPDGSASYNLYQFETSPLVARVSTNNRVGVIGNYATTTTIPTATNAMSPFLGVYETEPVVSALDIFWETSTSDYISNLNWDVLTGGDSITGYSNLGFIYNENQLFNGIGEDTGAENSPWITEWFYFINNAGVIVSDISSLLFSVQNRSGNDVTSNFQLVRDIEPGSPTEGYYRIKITQSETFFGTNVDTYGSFIFNFAITHTVGSNTYNPTITTAGEILKISNAVPVIQFPSTSLTPVFNLTSDPLVGPIVDCSGENGCAGGYEGNVLADLYWDIDPSNPVTPGLVSINSSNGDISVSTNAMPIGNTDVMVRLRDATNSLGIQTTGGLTSFRNVRLNVPNYKVGCGQWTSVTTITSGPFYRNVTQGYINVWKALRKNETISSNNSYIYGWRDNDGVYHSVTPGTWRVNFATVGYGESPSDINGFFSKELFASSTPTFPVATILYVQINLITSTGRNISFVFESIATIEPPITGIYQRSRCEVCTLDYVPSIVRDWRIENNSAFTIPWSGLHCNGLIVIGGTIAPGEEIGSAGFGGTYPPVRSGSLQAGGIDSPTGGYQIQYGGETTCPL